MKSGLNKITGLFVAERDAQDHASTNSRVAFAVSLLVLAGAITFRSAMRRMDQRLDAQVDSLASQARADASKLAQLRSQQSDLECRAKLAASRSRDALRSLLIAQLINALPPRASLSQIELDATGDADAESTRRAEAASSEPRPASHVRLKLIGAADTDAQVNAYASTLVHLGNFNDLKITAAPPDAGSRRSARWFEFGIELRSFGDPSAATSADSNMHAGSQSLSWAR